MLITGLTLSLALIILAIFPGQITSYDPLRSTYEKLLPPSEEHIMGTDQLGRDIFARIAHGTGVSLFVAIISVCLSIVAGVPIAAISGYFGGKLDRTLSLIFDALYAFPGIILAILIAVVMGSGATNTAIATSFGFIPHYFRIVRGLCLSIRDRPFIEAERALGASHPHIIFHHVIPYSIPSILTLTTMNLGRAIVTVSGLGFLGLGIQPPIPEWGTDLGRGRDFITIGVWWASTFPGLMILIAVLAFTFLGEGLGEIVGKRRTQID